MKLYHSPGSCSDGILFLLRYVGAEIDIVLTDLKQGAHRSPEYLELNPKGKVPALQLPDGTVLTEWPVIAYWIAKTYPDAHLLPGTLEEDIRVMELTEHIVSGLHMRGSVFAMVPQKFTTQESAQAELRAHGQAVVLAGFEALRAQLGAGPFLFEGFSIADAAALYLLSWHERIGVVVPPDLAAYQIRVAAMVD